MGHRGGAHRCGLGPGRAGDPIAIASYLGAGDSFDRALASFAEAYADQIERDYNALREPSCPAASRSRRASERWVRDRRTGADDHDFHAIGMRRDGRRTPTLGAILNLMVDRKEASCLPLRMTPRSSTCSWG